MPIYEYRCRNCGRRTEVIHGINEPGPSTCEVCGGVLAKMVSAPAIVFRGSGWAKKDAHAAATPSAGGGDGDGKEAAGSEPAGEKPGRTDGSKGAGQPAGDSSTAKKSDVSEGPAGKGSGSAGGGRERDRGSGTRSSSGSGND